MNRQKGFAPIILLLVIVGVIAVSGGIYYYQLEVSQNKESITPPAETPEELGSQESVDTTEDSSAVKKEDKQETTTTKTPDKKVEQKPLQQKPTQPICTNDKWKCGDWGTCSDSRLQLRTCALEYDCPTTVTPKPPTQQTCSPQCTEDVWICDEWDACSSMGKQSRNCTLTKDCPLIVSVKPVTQQSCTLPCTEDAWSCGDWSLCSADGSQSRTCSLTLDCLQSSTPQPTLQQSCTPSWKQQLDGLSLPGYSKSTDGFGNLVLTSEKYKVVLPDTNAEDYGKFRLNNLKVCSEFIENIIGQNPKIGSQIVDITVIDETRQFASCCGQPPDFEITNWTAQSVFEQQVYSSSAFWKNPSVDLNSCQGGHEETHRYVHTTSIPHWANEGLATFIEQKTRDLPGTLASRSLYSCDNNSFNAAGFSGGTVDLPYKNVTDISWTQPTIYYYYTGACFWDHLANNYGSNSIKQVISNLFSKTFSADMEFVQETVIPVTGSGIRSFLGNMGLNP